MPEIVWISPPKFDREILNEIRLLIHTYETRYKPNESSYNERATGQGLIEPLLEKLGWNTRDLDEVYPEYYVTDSGRVDYVLKLNKTPVIYLEIKKRVLAIAWVPLEKVIEITYRNFRSSEVNEAKEFFKERNLA